MSDFSIQRILVLDDDRIQHLLLQKRFNLISKEIELATFERAVEALEFLKKNSVDKVLTDLNLGVMDGWEFVDELEKINFTGRLFFLTGSIVPEDRRRAEEDPRITGFFEKPISEADLIQILNA
ncbi:response regulator [Algoriphagus lacus]|uniref:Response regulator n=1 Tax=Algoriphagus lacus TaxID=2056311 RepID=A0A418PM92_9BACT|nr:response regulator [Algoriphagus lacus]RIW12574.1 response regulator [Algoriphagus lacus]